MAACASCHDPLVIEVELEDEDGDMEMGESSAAAASTSEKRIVPDDVHLNCGCHFHWQCLLDAYQITECPNCHKTLTSQGADGSQQIVCSLKNEGGVQENLDILPMLTEESHLKAYPEERKARAFLEFCHAGDIQAIIEMIKFSKEASDEEEEHGPSMDQIYRYQDPIGNMQSGLHAAVEAGSREVVWLLLLMASELPLLEFPAEVFQEAENLGIMREEGPENSGLADIRALRDSDGKTAEDLAREMMSQGNAIWNGWIGNGKLAMT